MTGVSSVDPSMAPKVSVVVPCRNEAKFIEGFLEGIARQACKVPELECLLVDGRSEDGTREMLDGWVGSGRFQLRVLDNPSKVTPHALNIGIANARGGVIVRMDVHSTYPDDYVERLLDGLARHPEAGNVGGVWEILPSGDGTMQVAIADVTSSRWGMGGVDYRVGAGEEREVDTVPFGCFPREVFDEVGLFDEDMIRNQDDEFNLRLRKGGRKIIMLPDLVIQYHARPRVGQISRMFWQYGLFKPLVWMKNGVPATLRQFAPPAMVLSSFVCVALAPVMVLARVFPFLLLAAYVCLGLVVAAEKGRKSLLSIFANAWLLAVVHYSYGAGYLAGLARFGISRRSVPRLQPTR